MCTGCNSAKQLLNLFTKVKIDCWLIVCQVLLWCQALGNRIQRGPCLRDHQPTLNFKRGKQLYQNNPSLSLNWLAWGCWLDWWSSYRTWSWLKSKATQKIKIIWGEYILLEVEPRITVLMRKPWYPRSELMYSWHDCMIKKNLIKLGLIKIEENYKSPQRKVWIPRRSRRDLFSGAAARRYETYF